MDPRTIREAIGHCCCLPLTGEASASIRYEGVSVVTPPMPWRKPGTDEFYLTKTVDTGYTWGFTDALGGVGTGSYGTLNVASYVRTPSPDPEFPDLLMPYEHDAADDTTEFYGTLEYHYTYTDTDGLSWISTTTHEITGSVNPSTGAWSIVENYSVTYVENPDPVFPGEVPHEPYFETNYFTDPSVIVGVQEEDPGWISAGPTTTYTDPFDAESLMREQLDYGLGLLRAGEPLPEPPEGYDTPLSITSPAWAGAYDGADVYEDVPSYVSAADAIWDLDITAFYANKLVGDLRWRWQDAADEEVISEEDSTLAVTWAGSGKDPNATHPPDETTIIPIGDRILPASLPDPDKLWTAVQLVFRHRVGPGYAWTVEPSTPADLARFP